MLLDQFDPVRPTQVKIQVKTRVSLTKRTSKLRASVDSLEKRIEKLNRVVIKLRVNLKHYSMLCSV